MSPTQIERVVVSRFRCPWCRCTWAKKPSAQAHIERCWFRPANQACKTCVHYEPGYNEPCEARPGCHCQSLPEGCYLDLLPLDSNERVISLRAHCPSWQACP